MQKTRLVEISVGAFIALGIAALFVLALKVSSVSTVGENNSYELTARFENIGGLKNNSAIKGSGVLLGRVSAIYYDQETYEAVVKMAINNRYNRLPVDTSASIFTAGLLGEQYIGVEPGAEEEFLTDGDEISLTQSAVIVEQLLGQFLFEKGAEDGSE